MFVRPFDTDRSGDRLNARCRRSRGLRWMWLRAPRDWIWADGRFIRRASCISFINSTARSGWTSYFALLIANTSITYNRTCRQIKWQVHCTFFWFLGLWRMHELSKGKIYNRRNGYKIEFQHFQCNFYHEELTYFRMLKNYPIQFWQRHVRYWMKLSTFSLCGGPNSVIFKILFHKNA